MAKEGEKAVKKTTSLLGASNVGGVATKEGVGAVKDMKEAQDEAKEAQKRQEEQIGRQRQAEQLRLAEAESEIGRKRFLAKAGGRRSLIASR